MANKEVLDQINAERIRRTLALSDRDATVLVVLSDLADSWGREADLLLTSKKQGWQSERKQLISLVALLRAEIVAVGKLAKANTPPLREPVTGPTPSWTNPEALTQLVTEAQDKGLGKVIAGDLRCAAQGIAHDKHTWIGPRDEATGSDRWTCWGGDSIAEDVAAYLSGATESLSITLHTSDGTPYTVSGQTAVIERLGTHLYRESAVHHVIDEELPEVHADPITVPMFREADTPPPRARPVPPSMVGETPYTWADLAAPARPSSIPEHMSPSQLSTLDTCPAQARISRYEGMPGIPLWGSVGGTAFHRAVEEIEHVVAGETTMVEYTSYPEVLGRIWEQHFHAVVAEEIAKSGVPMSDWYASGSGKENYSWWLVEGGEMLKRYVTHRVRHDDGRKVLVLPDGRPAIELELSFELNGLPVKVILDIVWLLPDGSLEIWDHKTRRDYMGPIVDTIQLGTQGRALRRVLDDAHGGPWEFPTDITARYFDARKGQLTDAFDPLDRHPIEELEMRYADGDDKRRNRPAVPVRSNLCKACPVAYLCPVGSKL